ncbi:MAG: YfhO family protein, partial [Lutibacter sp.]|nr:YfhO family protein [Lutibacter sp.]
GGIALFFTIGGTGLFTFEIPVDIQIDEQLNGFLDVIVADRKTLFVNDSLRSFVFVMLFSGVLWLFLKEKINKNIVVITFGILVLVDLVSVDKRYVNDEFFTTARKVDKPFSKTEIDVEILKDKGHYRVANFTKNIMTDGSTSYFHKSIGGYHAAKPRRYQELYDFYLEKNNIEVLSMLNTKYFIYEDENQRASLQINPYTNGNAWFVNAIQIVENANEEILALDSLQTKKKAVIDKIFITDNFNLNYTKDSIATIKLTSYKANELFYESNTTANQFAVFSEIYYKNGWNAYIDGNLTPHYRVNYVLRGMEIPKGKHTIVFKFEPLVIKKGTIISLMSYLIFLIVSLGWFFIKKRKA